jgi:hypothetical protein
MDRMQRDQLAVWLPTDARGNSGVLAQMCAGLGLIDIYPLEQNPQTDVWFILIGTVVMSAVFLAILARLAAQDRNAPVPAAITHIVRSQPAERQPDAAQQYALLRQHMTDNMTAELRRRRKHQ